LSSPILPPTAPTMFTSFEEPDLAARARGLVWPPGGAFLLAQIYLTLYPLLTTVPSWLFEAVRLTLLLGTLGGIAGILYISYRGMRDRRWNWGVTLWLGVNLAFSLLSGHLLYGMSVPSL
jgi:hypothetical protein